MVDADKTQIDIVAELTAWADLHKYPDDHVIRRAAAEIERLDTLTTRQQALEASNAAQTAMIAHMQPVISAAKSARHGGGWNHYGLEALWRALIGYEAQGEADSNDGADNG